MLAAENVTATSEYAIFLIAIHEYPIRARGQFNAKNGAK
jgi:hypothetical protein